MNRLLLEEHELLGARIDAGEEGSARVVSYGDPAAELDAFAQAAALVDLGGIGAWRLSGAPAELFSRTAFAGPALALAECRFEAALLGDGSLASVPLVARTGNAEYVCWDGSARSELLAAWLRFLASVEQDGIAPYAELTIDEVDDALAPLALAGPLAPAILGDYLSEGASLPGPGTIRELTLDRIHALVMALPLPDAAPFFVILVPPAYVRVLWRSLLSFPAVSPAGEASLGAHVMGELPWLARVAEEQDKLWLEAGLLRSAGLVRAGSDYVGARGLASRESEERL